MEVNVIDLIIVLVLIVFTVMGYMRGFIAEIGQILAMIGGFFVANKFWGVVDNMLADTIAHDQLRMAVSYLIIFVIVAFIVTILAKIIQKFFEFIMLAWLNRTLGILLGLLKGLLVVSLLIFIVELVPQAQELKKKMEKESKMYQVCSGLKDWVMTNVDIKPFYDGLKDEIQHQQDGRDVNDIIKNAQEKGLLKKN